MKRGRVLLGSESFNSGSHFRNGLHLFNYKHSQITIFVIIAIIIVAGAVGYFLVKGKVFFGLPSEIQPVYDYYISCIEKEVRDGASIMASQAGYIEKPEFRPGSEYAPFSSELGFVGLGIPYWYFISANGIKQEQIPTLKEMQDDLSGFLEKNIDCDFSDFIAQGFMITLDDEADVETEIKNGKIILSAKQKIQIEKGESGYTLDNHKAEISSNLGNFYELATKIYEYEKTTSFLENYSIDILYTYAPVSGVELNCSPVIWNPYDVFSRLKMALEANLNSIRLKGNYYTLKDEARGYFIADKEGILGIKDTQVNIFYSSSFPSRFEVWPTKSNLMVANPVGNQPGLSMLGFCYTPYQFVYDMYFPVLIQLSSPDGEETFQFPVSVIIDKNVPRQAISSPLSQNQEDICSNANTDITINTYNINLEPVEADISFKCLTSSCDLGKTKINNATGTASLKVKVPQCINGVIIASGEGLKEKKEIVSTNEEVYKDIIMASEEKLELQIYVDGILSNDLGVLMINEKLDENRTEFIESVSYPYTKEISLGQGYYNFELKVYKSGTLTIPGTTSRQCVNVPRSGLLGFFGAEEEKCTAINVPSQQLTNLIYAGGSQNEYLTQTQLEEANVLKIFATSVKLPASLEEVQISFDAVENKKLIIELV